MKLLELPHGTADYLCPVNGLCDVYEWKTGNRIPEELIHFSRPGFQLISQETAVPPKMIYWGQGTIGKEQLSYWSRFIGYNIIADEGKTFQEALSEVKSLIDRNIPTILFGLDMYYLPYHTNFYQSLHIPGHVVLMVGYDNQEVYVHDNSKQGVQIVPLHDLQQAWAQDYIGISKRNAYFGIDMVRPNPDIADIIKQGMSKNAELYFNAPVDFIGKRSIDKLIRELPTWKNSFTMDVLKKIYLQLVEFTASVVPELPEVLSGFNSGIVNPHQGGRDRLASMLLKYQNKFGTPSWKVASELFVESGQIIESITRECIDDIRRESFENTDKLISLLIQAKSIEENAISHLKTDRVKHKIKTNDLSR